MFHIMQSYAILCNRLHMITYDIWYMISHRIHGAAIYGNIYHQYTPFMLAYIPAPWILWVMDGYGQTNHHF
jgi:hypothetical protein